MIEIIILTLLPIVVFLIFMYLLNKHEWKKNISRLKKKKLIFLAIFISLLYVSLKQGFSFSNLIYYLIEIILVGLIIALLLLKSIKSKILVGAVAGFLIGYDFLSFLLTDILKINIFFLRNWADGLIYFSILLLLLPIFIGVLIGFIITKSQKLITRFRKNKKNRYLLIPLLILGFFVVIYGLKYSCFSFVIGSSIVLLASLLTLMIIKNKIILICGLIGSIVGILKPLAYQNWFSNLVCSTTSGTTQCYSICTKEWHLLFYTLIFISILIFIGALIGFIIEKIKRR